MVSYGSILKIITTQADSHRSLFVRTNFIQNEISLILLGSSFLGEFAWNKGILSWDSEKNHLSLGEKWIMWTYSYNPCI